jgi:hypothetical protein
LNLVIAQSINELSEGSDPDSPTSHSLLASVSTGVTAALGQGQMALLLGLLVRGAVAAAAPRTNVLFVVVDNFRPAMGAYGNKVIQTPTLDKLAAEGALFEQAFCNTPVCSASRASYLTGRLPSQHGVHDWIAGGNGNAPNVVTYLLRGTLAYQLDPESGV